MNTSEQKFNGFLFTLLFSSLFLCTKHFFFNAQPNHKERHYRILESFQGPVNEVKACKIGFFFQETLMSWLVSTLLRITVLQPS
jgi:hypothetical protein